MMNLKAGLISGLIATLVALIVSFIAHLIVALVIQINATNVIAPFSSLLSSLSTTTFWVSLFLNILVGIVMGAIFVLLVKRPTTLKGIIFGLVLVWLPSMLVIFPLTGNGFFGQRVGWIVPVSTFILNALYGLVLGVFAERLVIVTDNFGEQIGQALTKALNEAIEAEKTGEVFSIDLATSQMVIFSDLHKGARDRADDFQVAERTYNAALSYYYHMEHTLVTLGDVEELWENRINPVLTDYKYTLDLEAKFHQKNRYLRFWGNHDDDWSHANQVQQFLDPIYGGAPLKVREGLRIHVTNEGLELGTLFMVHGHQGTVESDRLAFLSKPIVRFLWKPIQNLTGISFNTPSKNWQIRDDHNRAMYQWASKQDKLILVAGHTHRPVFLSRLHAAKIRNELQEAQKTLAEFPNTPLIRERVSLLAAELEWVLSQEQQIPGPEGLNLTPKPCHFNTGCCCFYDGDITGIEISGGEILLVRWPDNDGAPKPKILERARLTDVFATL
jgi:UDP-2,3-diacylglucosamine pyrophosphatase LpxH